MAAEALESILPGQPSEQKELAALLLAEHFSNLRAIVKAFRK
jgi:hypothetical protein